jgi:hypothetical protein
MARVYLLLRNNQETGPWSLEELVSLELKPHDLVWVEGRSAAWCYPTEIESLKHIFPVQKTESSEAPPVTRSNATEPIRPLTPTQSFESKKVFISLPKTPVPPEFITDAPSREHVRETQPERQEISSARKPVEDAPRTAYARSLNDMEEDYTNWVYRQKSRKKNKLQPKHILMASLLGVAAISGYFIFGNASEPLVRNNAQVIPTISTPGVLSNEPSSTQTDDGATTSREERLSDEPIANSNIVANKSKKSITGKTNHKNREQASMPISSPSSGQESSEKGSTLPPSNEEIADVTAQPSAPVADKAKKKKAKELIRDLFSRKNKKEESASTATVTDEDPRPANNRQAAKRNEADVAQEETVDEATLASQVEISSNAPDNWMMGIQNLKVTVRNRNSVALHSVSVWVHYFDSNKQLLEKKAILFSNVPAKGKQTVAAPDHKFADHVEFKLGNITRNDDRFARD